MSEHPAKPRTHGCSRPGAGRPKGQRGFAVDNILIGGQRDAGECDFVVSNTGC